MCRASADCSGANLGMMTIEECCNNAVNGLGFTEGENCSPCIGECMTLSYLLIVGMLLCDGFFLNNNSLWILARLICRSGAGTRLHSSSRLPERCICRN